MPTFVPCKKNDANGYTFYVSLVSQANTKIFQANPTLAAGDVIRAIDDAAPANLGTLPVVDADFTKRVKVVLSQAETNGDNITIIFSDAAGAEWCDLTVNIQTVARQIDDLAWPTTTGRSITVEADGMAHADLKEWLGVAPLALTAQRVMSHLDAVTAGVIAAASFAANALDAVWATAVRLLTAGTNIVLAKGVGVTGFNDLSAAQVNTEVDTALNTAIPGAPTADSINERIQTMDDADIPGRLPAALVGGRIDAYVGAVAAAIQTALVDDIWDEDIVTAHGVADTAGLLLRVLGAAISTRANNPTLNALLGAADVAGVDVPSQTTDEVWDEDIVAAHGAASASGLLLRVLGELISTRANNPTLNELLGVLDAAGADVPSQVTDEVWDELIATHVVVGSTGEALVAAAAAPATTWDELLTAHIIPGSTGRKLGDVPLQKFRV